MIPNPEIIKDAIALEDFVLPRNEQYGLMESWERGGAGIGNTSEPLTKYNWFAFSDGSKITFHREDDPNIGMQLQGLNNVTEIDATFDQNMRPCIAFVEDGESKLYWYDTVQQKMAIRVFPSGSVRHPRVSLDDKRPTAISRSDVILGYINQDNKLCYRQQRDRYDTEYVLKEFDAYPRRVLWRIGMTKANRFGFYVR